MDADRVEHEIQGWGDPAGGHARDRAGDDETSHSKGGRGGASEAGERGR